MTSGIALFSRALASCLITVPRYWIVVVLVVIAKKRHIWFVFRAFVKCRARIQSLESLVKCCQADLIPNTAKKEEEKTS